jgi:hypothetical protein
VHCMCECVCCYYFANLSTVSVCLAVHVRPVCFPPSVRIRTEGGKHNSTPTQAHTSWYSRHLCHILESVGRHRRDTLRRKIQYTTFRGAGACAHERRTGVVAAKGAVAKGYCPCWRLLRQEMPRCLGLFRQEILAQHVEAGEPPSDQEVLPKHGPAPNVGCSLKGLNRHR